MSSFLGQLRIEHFPVFVRNPHFCYDLHLLKSSVETKKVIDRITVFCYIARLKVSILAISATRFG